MAMTYLFLVLSAASLQHYQEACQWLLNIQYKEDKREHEHAHLKLEDAEHSVGVGNIWSLGCIKATRPLDPARGAGHKCNKAITFFSAIKKIIKIIDYTRSSEQSLNATHKAVDITSMCYGACQQNVKRCRESHFPREIDNFILCWSKRQASVPK